VLTVELHHALVFGLLLQLGVAGPDLLLARRLGDAQPVEVVPIRPDTGTKLLFFAVSRFRLVQLRLAVVEP
jgi:hypothetical protein